jgi:hypothetical protein
MTYIECINYLYNSLPVYQRTGAAAYKANLDNTLALMKYLDHPEKKVPIHTCCGNKWKRFRVAYFGVDISGSWL